MLALGDAVARLDGRGRLPAGTAAITFDDGFADNHRHALAVLQRHRLPATVFVVAATLTPEGQEVDWVDTPPPWRLATLTLDQILEMQEAGVTFGSHSWAHHVLPELSEEECRRDLRESRELLEDLLGRRVPLLAYPRGRHDEMVRAAAAAAGYSHAFSLPDGPEPPGRYAVQRVGIFRNNGLRTLAIKAQRWYLPVRTSASLARASRTLRGR